MIVFLKTYSCLKLYLSFFVIFYMQTYNGNVETEVFHHFKEIFKNAMN